MLPCVSEQHQQELQSLYWALSTPPCGGPAHLQLNFAGQVPLPGALLRHLATAVRLCSPAKLRLLLRIQLRLLDILGR